MKSYAVPLRRNYTTVMGDTLPPDELDSLNTSTYHIYLGLAFGAIALFVFKPLFFVFLINRSGRVLHNRALYAILRSPMRYFDTHPIGNITRYLSRVTYHALLITRYFCNSNPPLSVQVL